MKTEKLCYENTASPPSKQPDSSGQPPHAVEHHCRRLPPPPYGTASDGDALGFPRVTRYSEVRAHAPCDGVTCQPASHLQTPGRGALQSGTARAQRSTARLGADAGDAGGTPALLEFMP